MLKNVKKGDNVILKGFTGIKLGVFTVEKVTDKTIIILKKDGTKMVFSKKDGKQTNVDEGKERYANSIMEDDGSYVPPQRKKSTKKTEKKSKKAKKEVEEVDEEELEDYEEVEEESKKKAKKTSKKKAKPVVEEDDEDEFDEFDDFEEA